MGKKIGFKLLILLILGSMFVSCQKENELEIVNHEIEFSISFGGNSLKNGLVPEECNSLDNAHKIVLSIETEAGESTNYTDAELNFYKMGDSYFSEKIALKVGSYKLTKLLLVDKDNQVLFATPMLGSIQAQNVDNPLPIPFDVVKDQAIGVNVEVLCALGLNPDDFGLVGFWFEKIETISFMIAVSELGKNVILAANLEVSKDDYYYTQSLEAIANNAVTIKSGFTDYTLRVSKDGYQDYVNTFTKEELEAYEGFPLVVELSPYDLHDPVLEIQFDEDPYNHNMHITSDGEYFYTINGGDYHYGMIKKYSLDGNFVANYDIEIDGRGLSYNESDGYLYASLFQGHIVRIDNLSAGLWTTIYPDKMQGLVNWEQASFAISPDGQKMYDFYEGNLIIWDFQTGTMLETMSGFSYGLGNYGGDNCVAVDNDYIYTWNSSNKTVYVYDLSGNFVRELVLPHGNNGHSLSVFNGYLFVSKDGNYGTGTWYGYNIRRPVMKSGKIVVKAPSTTTKKSERNTTDTTY